MGATCSLIRNLEKVSGFGTQRVLEVGKTAAQRPEREAPKPEREWNESGSGEAKSGNRGTADS